MLEKPLYTVPQASTLRHSSDFRVFFTLFPNFRTFLLKTTTFSLRRATRVVARLFSQLSQGSRLLLSPFWQCYVGLTEHSCSNQRKHSKTRKIAIIAKSLCFFRSKASHRVSLHCKKCHRPAPTIPHEKRCNLKAFANHDPSERHFLSIGGIFATQFLHIQTSLRLGVWTVSFVRSCTHCPPKFKSRGRLHEKWETANPDTPFCIPFALVEYGLSPSGTCYTWLKKLKKAKHTG